MASSENTSARRSLEEGESLREGEEESLVAHDCDSQPEEEESDPDVTEDMKESRDVARISLHKHAGSGAGGEGKDEEVNLAVFPDEDGDQLSP
eukprot:2149966-Rhodomonas_salina.1